MRVTDAALLGLLGLAATGVLVATASGLFADPPPDLGATARQVPQAERVSRRLVDPSPVVGAPAPAGAAAPSPAPALAAPAAKGEWTFPPAADVKSSQPPDPQASLQRPTPVLAPGEQQAAWAARDQLANAARAKDRRAVSPSLTRPHEGPAPDKAGADR
ncbi:MAG: hypothetical protein H7322_20115 [Ramlibacter sp.]|nr:hypothetical protein [Ramlibacter sp.]